jgi:hypothetical protein
MYTLRIGKFGLQPPYISSGWAKIAVRSRPQLPTTLHSPGLATSTRAGLKLQCNETTRQTKLNHAYIASPQSNAFMTLPSDAKIDFQPFPSTYFSVHPEKQPKMVIRENQGLKAASERSYPRLNLRREMRLVKLDHNWNRNFKSNRCSRKFQRPYTRVMTAFLLMT